MKKKVKLSIYKPRLAALLKRPGGITAEQAIKAADANLESIRGRSLVEMDKVIGRLVAMRPVMKADPSIAQTDRLYALAGTVTGIAGSFGLSDVQTAASSLCELIDELDLKHRASLDAVDVHLRSLQLLRMAGQEASPDQAAVILAGLAEVVRMVAAKAAVKT